MKKPFSAKNQNIMKKLDTPHIKIFRDVYGAEWDVLEEYKQLKSEYSDMTEDDVYVYNFRLESKSNPGMEEHVSLWPRREVIYQSDCLDNESLPQSYWRNSLPRYKEVDKKYNILLERNITNKASIYEILIHNPNTNKDYLFDVCYSYYNTAWSMAQYVTDLIDTPKKYRNDIMDYYQTLRNEGWTVRIGNITPIEAWSEDEKDTYHQMRKYTFLSHFGDELTDDYEINHVYQSIGGNS